MAIDGIIIRSYKVTVNVGEGEGFVRRLFLESGAGEPNPIHRVTVSFYEEPPAQRGRTGPSGRNLFVEAPLRDFDVMYHILQSEKPVYALWSLDDGGRLASFQLGTAEYEPLGEGQVDGSSSGFHRVASPRDVTGR